MSGIEGKVVAITGASSGIGEATALLLAERGAAVVLGARRTERLDELANRIRQRGGRGAPRGPGVPPRRGLARRGAHAGRGRGDRAHQRREALHRAGIHGLTAVLLIAAGLVLVLG